MAEHSENTWTIARAAHECWCRAMRKAGWTPGDRYDPDRYVHDALRPFDELSAFERDAIARHVQDDELEKHLVNAVYLRRGPTREFTADEVKVGLRVRHADTPPGDGAEFGTVQSWIVEDREVGRLATIRVKWDDGTVQEHPACECELARPEPEER